MRTLLAAVLAVAIAAVPGGAAAAGRIAVLPWAVAPPAPQYAWLGDGPHVLTGLILGAQAGWDPLPAPEAARIAAAWGPLDGPPSAEAVGLLGAAGAAAALAATVDAQSGALRLQADLYVDVARGDAPLRFAVAGRPGQATAIALALAELAGEALTGGFPRTLRPPVPSAAEFLLARLEPSFGARDPLENVAQSEAFMLTALKIDPNNADAYFQLGSLYGRNNQVERALEHLGTAVELSPRSPRYHWGLGVAYFLQGQLDEALTEFLQSTVIDEAYVEGFVALAALHLRLNDPEASRAALERAAAAKPDDPLVLASLGVNAYLAKDPDAAREHFEKARALNPKASAASVNLALLKWEDGDVDGARKELERTLSAEPSHPEALVDLGVVEAARGAFDQAAARYKQALDAGAPRRATLFNLGTLQLQAGALPEAQQTLERVIDLDPAHVGARNNLGVILLLRGRVDEALANFAAARPDAPGAAQASYNLALLHQLGRSGQQALVHYLRALQADRGFTLAHINLGVLFEGMGRPEKALTEYLKALSSAELHPEVYTWLGQLYAQRGYGSMTEETIRKTTLVDPTLPLAWHALATSFEALDRGKAAVAWRQFLDAVRRDRNRAFWIPLAEQRLAAAGGR